MSTVLTLACLACLPVAAVAPAETGVPLGATAGISLGIGAYALMVRGRGGHR